MKITGKGYGLLTGMILIFFVLPAGRLESASGHDRPVIAVIRSGNIEPYNQAVDGFKEELKASGIKYIVSYYDLERVKGREKSILGEAKDLNPDLVLTVGTEATVLCKDFFEEKPVVFTMVLDPVKSRITEHLGPTGTNMTGVILAIPVDAQLKTLREVVPEIKVVGMLYDGNTRTERVKEIYSIAQESGLVLVAKPVRTPRDIPSALNSITKESDAIWAEVDTLVYNQNTAQEIILTTLRGKIPFMAFSAPYVKAGALLALGCDYYDIGRQTGEIAKNILHGKDPGTISIAFPRKRDLVINKRTAETIEIKIPSQTSKQAVKVFE